MNLNKNKKGSAEIGGLILVFIGVIVAIVLLQSSAQQLTLVTNTLGITNASVTFPTNTTALVLNGQAVTNVIIVNATDASKTVPATNYTITNYGLSNTGTLQSTIIAVGPSGYQGEDVNISYRYEPLGYAKESSSRTIVGLIVLLSALAVAVWVLSRVMEDGVDAFR